MITNGHNALKQYAAPKRGNASVEFSAYVSVLFFSVKINTFEFEGELKLANTVNICKMKILLQAYFRSPLRTAHS